MAVRTLAVIPFDAAQADWLIDRAAEVAVGFDAHLVAVYPFDPVVWTIGGGARKAPLSSLLEAEDRQAARMRAMFDAVLDRKGLRGEFRMTTDLRLAEALLMETVRTADAIILGAAGGHVPDDRIFMQHLVRHAGRPVLVLGQQTHLTAPARRVLIGWTDTRDAARAAQDMPGLAAPDAEITILPCAPQPTGPAPAPTHARAPQEELAAALNRAGFRVAIADPATAFAGPPGDLRRVGRRVGADLLATGALGGSPDHALLVDAVTRDLRDVMHLPVLLLH